MCSHCLTDKSFSLLQSLPRQTVPSNGPCGPMGAFRIISRRGNSGPRGAYVFSFDRYCQSTFQNKPSVNSPTSRSAALSLYPGPGPRLWFLPGVCPPAGTRHVSSSGKSLGTICLLAAGRCPGLRGLGEPDVTEVGSGCCPLHGARCSHLSDSKQPLASFGACQVP